MATALETVRDYTGHEYKYGFVTEIESDIAPKGLDEEIVRFISAKKHEPEWLTEWRLKALERWRTMEEPGWARVSYPPIDFQAISYYAAPKSDDDRPKSLAEVDPELLRTYEKLGIPIKEQEVLAGVAMDYVFDSVSVATTFKKKLGELGIIFCSISEAVAEPSRAGASATSARSCRRATTSSPRSIRRCSPTARSSTSPRACAARWSCRPTSASTPPATGQFERTLIIADAGSYVSYLEGCTAPQRDENQLHAAVVELIALDDAQIKYSTVQNWYPGDREGKGGIYNFVTKRGACRGRNSKISWTQVETGSAITWKYPSCILQGDNSVGEFYSVAVTNNHQQADTGTKMIHIGKNTRSRIVSKGISAGRSNNTYRGLVRVLKGAEDARNHTQCDSMLIGDRCGAHTVPYIEVKNRSAKVEHEATTSKISEDQLFYCRQRGLSDEDAVALIVNGFCQEVMQELPMEFAVEAQKLLAISLEGSVG